MPDYIRNFILLCFLISTGFAGNKHVIYITYDGMRWQDLFLNKEHFSILWGKYADQLIFYGQPGSNSQIEVASVPISLPSYQSQMTGFVQPCMNNHCGLVQQETFPEILVTQYGLNKKEVAIFSSWSTIAHAAEHIPGTVFTNIGNVPMFDPENGYPDPIMEKINQEQVANPDVHDGEPNRFDQYTFSQALHYFERYQPRFLWIALGDSDNAAHRGDLAGYQRALDFYDEIFDTLVTTLSYMHLLQDTVIIVTTDHGRGNEDHWTDHGPNYPESKQTWAFTMNGALIPVSQEGKNYYYSTLSIQPTVLKYLG